MCRHPVAQTVFIVCGRQNFGDFKTNLADFLLCRHPVAQTVFIVCGRQIFGDFKTKLADFLLCRHPVAQTVFIVCVRQIFGDFKTNLADFFVVQTPGGAVDGQHPREDGVHGGSPHLGDSLASAPARNSRRGGRRHQGGAPPLPR